MIKLLKRSPLTIVLTWLLFVLSGCTGVQPQANPEKKAVELYDHKPISTEVGIAAWYGGRWIGRKTANGERYRAGDVTAAHKKLPFNSKVRVTNLSNGKSVIVRINNRGPYIKGRIIDLSVVAAKQIGMYEKGLTKVKLEVLREIPIVTKPNLRVKHTTKKKDPRG